MSLILTKATAILRGYDLSEVMKICEALKETKEIRNVEITLNTLNAYEILEKVSYRFGKKLNIGAGTVMTKEQGEKAYRCGAKFFLSPTVMSKELISFCKEYEILTVSGAFSATEVVHAANNGADIVKIFPATSLSDTYFKDIKSHLGNIPLRAVGGINKKNSAKYLENGADYLGIGNIFGKVNIRETNLTLLSKLALEFEKFMNNEEKNNGRIGK